MTSTTDPLDHTWTFDIDELGRARQVTDPDDNTTQTIWWGDGLAEPPGYVRPAVYTRPRGPDERVRRITRNLLDRFRESPV